MRKKSLVITGFHRSGTSACAQWLGLAGLNLGHDLMPADISNTKGHYEDNRIVNVHNHALALAGTSWQFHDEVRLSDVDITDILERYIGLRDNENSVWGVKDPRACLFLDDWRRVMAENGIFLFIFRHWASCVESLLNRHSRDLAFHTPVFSPRNESFAFWDNPALAAKMWLSYNARMLGFARRYPDRCLLVTQEEIRSGIRLPSLLNKKFGLRLNEEVVSPIDLTLFSAPVDQQLLGIMPSNEIPALNQLWSEVVVEVSKGIDADSSSLRPLAQGGMSNSESRLQNEEDEKGPIFVGESSPKPEDVRQPVLTPDLVDLVDLVDLDNHDDFVAYFDFCFDHLNGNGNETIKFLRARIDQFDAPSLELIISLARWLQSKKFWKEAIIYWEKALKSGAGYPYIYNNIGSCYQGLLLDDMALKSFDRAIEGNPNNVNFLLNKALLLKSHGQMVLAEDLIQSALELSPGDPRLNLGYALFSSQKGEVEHAVAILERYCERAEEPDERIIEQLSRLKMQRNPEAGRMAFLSEISSKLAGDYKDKWLSKNLPNISGEQARVDLRRRVHDHWSALEQVNTAK